VPAGTAMPYQSAMSILGSPRLGEARDVRQQAMALRARSGQHAELSRRDERQQRRHGIET